MTSYRILIVDDHHEIRRMLHAMLDTLGPRLQVTELPSGEEALLENARRPADLLVSDVRLPGITGLELMAKMRQRNPTLRVILITGLTDTKTRKDVATAGANAFFIKPIDMAEFLDAVERLLGMVEGILPPAPIVTVTTPPRPVKLADLLASLRQKLNAHATLLIDDQGQVHAQAGEAPGSNGLSTIIPILITTLSSSIKVSFALGVPSPLSLLIYKGTEFDLYVIHAGSKHALLAVMPRSPESIYPEKIGPAMDRTAREILAFLDKATGEESAVIETSELKKTGRLVKPKSGPLSPRPEAPSPAPELPPAGLLDKIKTGMLSRLKNEKPEEAQAPATRQEFVIEEEEADVDVPPELLPEVDAIFKHKGAKTLKDQDLDDFWDTASDESGQENVRGAAALTYEEAQKLGLAPKDKEK